MLSDLTEIHDASFDKNRVGNSPPGNSGQMQTEPMALATGFDSATVKRFSNADLKNKKPSVGINSAIKSFCSRNTGKGIVVIVSDLMDKNGYESGLKMLLAKELDIFIVHLLSPEEVTPTITGDLKLVDCEDGDSREVSISAPLLSRYQKTLAGFMATAKDFCQRRGIAYVSSRSDTPVETLIEQYLRLRGLVR
jgi:hypothetical protein